MPNPDPPQPIDPQQDAIAADAQVAPHLAQYITQDLNDRQIRLEREENERQARRRRQHQLDDKSEAKEQVNCVPPCDGSSPAAVRDWIREVQLTIPYTQYTIYVAQRTARGMLRTELEYYLSSQRDRNAVTWAQVRQFVQKAFLSPHEDERLRHELDNLRQSAFETSAFFGRRFRSAAELAYPTDAQGARNEDQNRIIMKAYLKGISDKFMKHRLIRDGRPNTLEEAMTLMDRYEADECRIRMAADEGILQRYEEPMEVGAMAESKYPNSSSSNDISEMKRQITGLQDQFTKLMATLSKDGDRKKGADKRPQHQKGQQPDQRGSHDQRRQREQRQPQDQRRSGPTDEPNWEHTFVYTGRPGCEFCGKRGHTQDVCRSKERQRKAQQSSFNQQRSGGY